MASAPTVIAFDVMGSDLGPVEIIRGAAQLSLEAPHIHALLVGDRKVIEDALDDIRHNAERIAVHHASQHIAMGETPGEALDAKPDASILVAARVVRDGGADALVSAGNTGACVLACARTFSLIPGVRRAALAAVYPTQRRRGEKEDPFSLILDVGATVEATPDDLVAFAVMGSTYAKVISKNPNPKVALLSNGSEAQKGTPQVKEAYTRLQSMDGLRFVGNIEGIDIPLGTSDVVVCDGFVGNVVLKMLEGVQETVVGLAKYAVKERLLWRVALALLSSGIQQIKDITDWKQYGGAPVLGFDRLFIKAHGRSNARAIANAGKVAAKAAASDVVESIRQGLAK